MPFAGRNHLFLRENKYISIKNSINLFIWDKHKGIIGELDQSKAMYLILQKWRAEVRHAMVMLTQLFCYMYSKLLFHKCKPPCYKEINYI